MRRTLLLVGLVFAVAACGSSSARDPTSAIAPGATDFAIPLLPDSAGETLRIGFKNLAGVAVVVEGTAYMPDGTAYGPGTVFVPIPAEGETRLSLTQFTGGATDGGWLHVDTSGAGVAAPFVYAYADRRRSGPDSAASRGLVFRSTGAHVAFSPFADIFQIVNASYGPGMVPIPVTYAVSVFEFDGDLVGTAPVAVPAHGSVSIDPSSIATPYVVGDVYLIEAEPMGLGAGDTARYGIAARERGLESAVETRFMRRPGRRLEQVNLGFPLRFGIDVFGNVHDFGLMVTNPTLTNQTLTIRAIYAASGAPILTTPRFVGIDPKSTKYLATTNADSRGLETAAGETSPFADLFGDVAVAGGLQFFWIYAVVPPEISVSVRHFDSLFDSYFKFVPERRLTNHANVVDIPIQQTLLSGTRNWIHLMNPTANTRTVYIQGHTPGGTLYVLDPILVGPFERLDWSPDGLIFREDPNDPSLPPVSFMSFKLAGDGGLFAGGSVEIRDATELLVSLRPHIVRDLANEN